MGKRLFLLFVLALSLFSLEPQAFAGGKLQMKQYYDHDSIPSKYSIGLSSYEKLFWNFYSNSWIGGGADNDGGSDPWLKVDQTIEAHVWWASLGLGGSYTYVPNTKGHECEMHVSLGATLW